MNMVQRLPIYASRSEEIIAYAWVDDDDYAHLATYRWVMPGTPEAPGSIYRARGVGERAAHEHPALVLSQEIVPHSGHVTFRNGDRLDYRKANLVTSHNRQQCLEHGAGVLRRMNRLHAPQPGSDASVTLPLTQGWTAWIDAEWEDDVRRYHWYMARQGTHVYAQRQRKQGRTRTIISLARVIAGLQDIDSGERLRPGVVTYQTPADVHRQLLDLRRTNLIVTTRGGVTLRRPCPQRYRGVHAVGRTGRYRATLSIGGHYRVLGLYDTPEEAAQARDAAIIGLGLQDIAPLNNP
jgi:hypothetical protein